MSKVDRWSALESEITAVLEQTSDYRSIIDQVKPHLQRLLEWEDLIPAEYQTPLPNKYAQYLLYKPSNEAFSVIAFVWGPGQVAPVHDHLIWGLVGVYKGAVIEKRYRKQEDHILQEISEVVASAGQISYVYPPVHDIHGVSNPYDEIAITVHIYGTDIGKQARHIHDVTTGQTRDVVTHHDNEKPIYANS